MKIKNLYKVKRKHKVLQRRALSKNLRNKASKTIHLDDEQVEQVVNALSANIEQTASDAINEVAKLIGKENNQRKDFFSLLIKVAMTSVFVLSGVLFAIAIFNNWNTLCSNDTQIFGVAILLIYCLIFIGLGIDIWREKDRNYIISVFSALVALAAMVIAVVV